MKDYKINLTDSIDVLDISVRCLNTLKANNINTVEDLMRASVIELTCLRGVGKYTLKELEKVRDELTNSLADMKVLIIKRFDRYYQFIYPAKITEKTAQRLQMEASYYPAGYSFYDFSHVGNKSTWKCWSS